jgi:hypothetical protein
MPEIRPDKNLLQLANLAVDVGGVALMFHHVDTGPVRNLSATAHPAPVADTVAGARLDCFGCASTSQS